MQIQEALVQARQKLQAVTSVPHLEAVILLAHVLQMPRSLLYAHPERWMTAQQDEQFMQYIARRCQYEPLAYVLQQKEFWSILLQVTPATLIPRPETEMLVDMVLQLEDGSCQSRYIADLGTGSGAIAIALALARPNWHVYATDNSLDALHIAQTNAKNYHIKNIRFYPGYWCEALAHVDRKLDYIVSNPPYLCDYEVYKGDAALHYEPYQALAAGVDGLQAIREIIAVAPHYLRQGGGLLLEHGWRQGVQVRELFAQQGYHDVATLADLAGHERVTRGYKH